jgi:hypothetical protein
LSHGKQLFEAIELDNLKKVKEIIGKYPDLLEYRLNDLNDIPIYYAVIYGRLEIFKFLADSYESAAALAGVIKDYTLLYHALKKESRIDTAQFIIDNFYKNPRYNLDIMEVFSVMPLYSIVLNGSKFAIAHMFDSGFAYEAIFNKVYKLHRGVFHPNDESCTVAEDALQIKKALNLEISPIKNEREDVYIDRVEKTIALNTGLILHTADREKKQIIEAAQERVSVRLKAAGFDVAVPEEKKALSFAAQVRQ